MIMMVMVLLFGSIAVTTIMAALMSAKKREEAFNNMNAKA